MVAFILFSRRMEGGCILIGCITWSKTKLWNWAGLSSSSCLIQEWQIRVICSTSNRNRLHYKSSYHWQTITFRPFQTWAVAMFVHQQSYSSQKLSEDVNIRKLLLGELLELISPITYLPHISNRIMKIKDRKCLLVLIESALLPIQNQFECSVFLSFLGWGKETSL